MTDTRKKNANWRIGTNGDGTTPKDDAALAVLVDIRDELQSINSKLGCHRIPRALDAISRIDRRLQNSGLLVAGRGKSRK